MTTTMETPAEKVDLKTTEEQVENVDKVKDADVASPTEDKDKLVEEVKKEKVPVPTVHKKDFEKDIVYLYQFNRCPTLPSCSPFCLKVETFLRMSEIKYQNIDHKLRLRSKKGQLPFVELNGKEIADSDIIIKELSEYFEKNLDADLSEDQKTVSYALESMLNNHTSWVVRWWRYNNPQGFLDATGLDLKQTLSSRLPKPFCTLSFKLFFKNRVKQAVGHGIGRHTEEEIIEFGKQDIAQLSQALGTKDYFFGSKPHILDCHAFAHLTQFIYVPFHGIDNWIKETHPNLISFVDRMKDAYFPDWERMKTSLNLNTHLYSEGEEPPKSDAEKKQEEIKKAKEEAKKAKDEAKKLKDEQKKKEKEEKERKKAEEAERKKAEKEKAEKEKAEAAEKAKADAAAAAAATAAEEAAKTEEAAKPAEAESAKPAEATTTEAAAAPAEEKKD